MLPRKVRGFLGVMATWGVTFSAFSTIWIGALFLLHPLPEGVGFRLTILGMVALRSFVSGAIAGGLFAVLLAGREKNRDVSTVSAKRAALWGFLGAAGLPLLTFMTSGIIDVLPLRALIAPTVISGVFGSVIAASTIAIARRAPALPSERPPQELRG